eukprot:1184813-Prorocentrum_minimum.AAC.4
MESHAMWVPCLDAQDFREFAEALEAVKNSGKVVAVASADAVKLANEKRSDFLTLVALVVTIYQHRDPRPATGVPRRNMRFSPASGSGRGENFLGVVAASDPRYPDRGWSTTPGRDNANVGRDNAKDEGKRKYTLILFS